MGRSVLYANRQVAASASAVEQLGSQLAEPLAAPEGASAHRLFLLRAPPGLSLRARLPHVGPSFFAAALRAPRPSHAETSTAATADAMALALAPSPSPAHEDPLRALNDLLHTHTPVHSAHSALCT